MEIQLQELLDRIRRDGLEAAESQAAVLLLEAEERKKTLLAEAEREAASIREKARSDAAREEEAGRAALSRAARDLILSFRDQIGAVLNTVVAKDVSAAMSADILRDALPGVLKSLAAGGAEDLAVLLDPEILKKIQTAFDARLKNELLKGVELRPYSGLSAGFRVAEKNGAAFYDFSADAVAELFARNLNERLAGIVREAAKGL